MGFATGFAFLAQRALFWFRDGSLGLCALPEDFCTVGFAVCFPAEDLFCCFILSHFGTGLVAMVERFVVELGAAHICFSFRFLV
jgi:hypothetical protein